MAGSLTITIGQHSDRGRKAVNQDFYGFRVPPEPQLSSKGIAVAVVGYTDALVATLFAQNGVPSFVAEYDAAEVERQLDAIEQELSRTKKSSH